MAVVLAGCSYVEGPESGARPALTASPGETTLPADATESDLMGIDGRFFQITTTVPEFGGYWINRGGDVVIGLTDLSKSAVVETVTRNEVDIKLAQSGGQRRYEQVTCSFGQLFGWKESVADPLLQMDGVTFIDVDQASNKILVGVVTASDVAGVPTFATNAGIPSPAIHTAVVGRISPSHGGPVETARDDEHLLSERFVTTLGGIMVRNGRDDEDRCSLLLGVTVGGAERYVTASHCPWTDDGEYGDFASLDTSLPLYQARTLASDRLGYEVADPSSTCSYDGGDCRWADAALFGQSGSDDRFRQGRVATTVSAYEDDGDKSTHHNHENGDSVYVMTGEGGESEPNWPVSGQSVIKVGFASGRSRGIVVYDCLDLADWPNRDRGYTLRCQSAATYHSEGGDSGAPVFASDGSFFGLHIGHIEGVVLPIGHFDFISYYSPIANIEEDPGAMDTEGEEHLAFHMPYGIWTAVFAEDGGQP